MASILSRKFLSATLLGFGSFLALNANAHSHGDHEQSTSSHEHTLFATESTRAFLGDDYAKKVVEWAGMNVLVMTTSDVNRLSSDPLKKDIVQQLQNTFPEFPISFANSASMIQMAHDIGRQVAPSAHGFNPSPNQPNAYCVIAIPDAPLSGDEWFSLASYQETSITQNVQSPGNFWFSMFLAHETDHCDIIISEWQTLSPEELITEKIRIEAKADQFALDMHQHEHASFIEEWKTSRAIGSLEHTNMEYLFAGALTNGQPHTIHDGMAILDGVSFIWKKIGQHESLDKSLLVMAQAEFLQENLASVENDTSDFNNAIHTLTHHLSRHDIDNFGSHPLFPKFNGLVQEKIDTLMHSGNQNKQLLAQMAPLAIRQYLSIDDIHFIAKDIYEQGGFDENPLAKKNVSLFINGIEHHIPTTIRGKPADIKMEN